MNDKKLQLLITRPENQGRVLANKLSQVGIASFCQPLFDYKTTDRKTNAQNSSQIINIESTFTANAIVIFVSIAAVEHANKIMPITLWRTQNIIAVGSATQKALTALNLDSISPENHDSEGVLALTELSAENVKNQLVVIVKGDGGRELIAQTLTKRLAKVIYFESYQRIWRNFPDNITQKWQADEINAIVITSKAALMRLTELLSRNARVDTPCDTDDKNLHKFNDYWKNSCLWIVASQRIADYAKQLGLTQVINAHGANDKAMLSILLKIKANLNND
ncbi:MAG: uroporphyrinogen-III synthase [Alteromonadaceae bacterium]|nr:uroporphyrinogen-III synthase [Alteromonadaceae bacterium]